MVLVSGQPEGAPVRLFRGRAVETVGLDDVGWPGLGEGSCPELPNGRYQERKEEQDVNLRIFRRVPARKRGLLAVLAPAVAVSTSLAVAAGAGQPRRPRPSGRTRLR
jgi:hypothetical protein